MEILKILKKTWRTFRLRYIVRMDKGWGKIGYGSYILTPGIIAGKHNIFLGDYTHIDWNNKLYCAKGKFIVGNEVTIAAGFTVVTDNHRPLIGEKFRARGNENLEPRDVIIEDDVWIAINVTLLAGVHIGRGAIIGGGTVLANKTIPPYAVVVGNPGKIIGFRFTPNEIVQHEMSLYPEEDRLPLNYLQNNYNSYYVAKKTEIKEFTRL